MSEGSSSWLCPTELDRTRVVDANDRVRMIRLVGAGAVGVALLAAAPWIGWWTLLLFGLCALNFASVDRRMRTSAHPERVSATAIVLTLLLLGGGVAVSGGPASPALPWMVLPAAMVAARFRPTVVVVGLALTVVLILAATLGVDPTATIDDPVRPIAALALLAGVVSIVWALQAAELHHRDEAILDPLTGLLNRHALIPRFTEISHQARLTHQPVCMLLCDVDAFKQVNDRHGHDCGDAVLRDVAYELRKRLRSFELAYRLGGEEFLIVLPGVSHAEGLEIAERLRAAVAQARPTDIPVTISLGLAAAIGEEVVYETLFKAADEALYEAKRAGRNRVAAAPAPAGDPAGAEGQDLAVGVAIGEPATPALVVG
jgi:diguanylate cyclase (GGDEF)-like protein